MLTIMYVDTSCYIGSNGKRYKRYLLRESYRENGKVKKRCIASLSRCSEEEIRAIKYALKHKRALNSLPSTIPLPVRQGKSYGALTLILEVAKQLGIQNALGRNAQSHAALWQIYSRLVAQGSRQTSLRLFHSHEMTLMPSLPELNEKTLYRNLAWLAEEQSAIEERLWKQRAQPVTQLFLYDVTSSYLEGQANELAAYGYNRDQKKGKKQIVIGLLTDAEGCPVAIRVFDGNTNDPKTFPIQIQLLQERFKIKEVVLVGDGGMLKKPQISMLPETYRYITSIGKREIESLIKQGAIQLDFFDTTLCDIESNGIRYILRRNPVRQQEIEASRKDKLEQLKGFIKAQNTYLREHARAQTKVAERKLTDRINRYGMKRYCKVDEVDRHLSLEIDQDALDSVSRLDGCYCVKTDIPQNKMNKECIHARYKDLAYVESAFRTMKTSHLEIRPVYLRKANHTRGHVFIVMLAYCIERHLQMAWRETGLTVAEGLQQLMMLTTVELTSATGHIKKHFPRPNEHCEHLFKLAHVNHLPRE